MSNNNKWKFLIIQKKNYHLSKQEMNEKKTYFWQYSWFVSKKIVILMKIEYFRLMQLKEKPLVLTFSGTNEKNRKNSRRKSVWFWKSFNLQIFKRCYVCKSKDKNYRKKSDMSKTIINKWNLNNKILLFNVKSDLFYFMVQIHYFEEIHKRSIINTRKWNISENRWSRHSPNTPSALMLCQHLLNRMDTAFW